MNAFVTAPPPCWKPSRLRFCIQGSKNGAWGGEPGSDEKDVICVRVADFDWNHLSVDLATPTVRAVSSDQFAKLALRPGDILIEKSGGGEKTPVGRVVMFDANDEAISSNFVARLRPAGTVVPKFLLYVLAALYQGGYAHQFIKQNTGIQNLDDAALFATPIHVPDFTTQKRIADFLDRETARVNQLIVKKQGLLELLDERLHTLISNLVTCGIENDVEMVDTSLPGAPRIPAHWELIALGKKIRLQRGVDITKDQQAEGPYPVVSSGGVSSYHDKYICKGPGVLIGRKGSAGKLHYEERDHWPHDTTLYVKKYFGNHPKFVFYKLMSLDLASFDRSSANPTINRNVLHPVTVSWPPIREQQQIANLLDNASERVSLLREKMNRSIDRLREFRSALITTAVTGQIDVEHWRKHGNTEPPHGSH